MTSKISVCIIAAALSTFPSAESEWDKLVDDLIANFRSNKYRKPVVGFQETGERLHTLFRSHSLSHVQISHKKDNGKKELTTDLYYGQGELYVVQHVEGWNLVTKGNRAFEWRLGSRTGDNSPIEMKELIAYTIYLTDPAGFPSSLYQDYLSAPDSFETPVPGNAGCTKLRPKEPIGGFTEIQVDLKRNWYGEFEFNGKAGVPTRWIFSKPTAIRKIPDEVYERMKQIRFRMAKKSLRRHRGYL